MPAVPNAATDSSHHTAAHPCGFSGAAREQNRAIGTPGAPRDRRGPERGFGVLRGYRPWFALAVRHVPLRLRLAAWPGDRRQRCPLTFLLWSLLTASTAGTRHTRPPLSQPGSPGAARTEPQRQSAEPGAGAEQPGASQAPFPAQDPARCEHLRPCTPRTPGQARRLHPAVRHRTSPRFWPVQARNKLGDNPLMPAGAKPPLSGADLFLGCYQKVLPGTPKHTEQDSVMTRNSATCSLPTSRMDTGHPLCQPWILLIASQ
jgi:hypothetical protein